MKVFLLIFFSLGLYSQAHAKFSLSDVVVECVDSIVCKERRERFKTLIGDYRSLVHLKETLKVLASDGGYQLFSYKIIELDSKHSITIKFDMKPIIEEINIGFTDRSIDHDPAHFVSIREGEYFEKQKLSNSLVDLKKRLESMGFPNNTYRYELVENKQKIKINIAVTLGKPLIFKNIKTNTKSLFVRDFLIRKFFNLYNKPFEITKFKSYLDDAQKELFSYGYYLIGLDFVPLIKGNRVTLNLKISDEKLFAFDFKNLEKESRDVIHNIVVDLFRKYKRPLSTTAIKNAILEHYRNKALLNAQVNIETSILKNKNGENIYLYRIKLDEHFKTRIDKIIFTGNNYFSENKLQRMFSKEAFELASIKYFDQEYFSYFLDYLKAEYIKRGFVQARVQGPNIVFDENKKMATVDYVIHEGTRAFVRTISFSGLPYEYEDKLLLAMSNKVGKAFNPISMVEDIKLAVNILQEKGYYYAEIENANDPNLVKYSKSGSDVDIHFKINLGSMIRLNRVLFLGNDKTNKKVLWKKIPLTPGDKITPMRTREIESSISSTGLFNSVTVTPIKHSSPSASTDLLIKVVERDYGLIEFAPGYRTDLGIKLTGTASYLNIGGMNRSITLRSQLNQRLNFQTLDPDRRGEAEQLLEHNTSLSYSQGDIFDSLIDLGASAGYQFKRFYSFDAEILRTNLTLTRDLSKKLSSSVRYQLEDITQENATNEQDNGNFKIGAITPSLTYDLRNSQINPVKGAFFNLSCEFANPFFLSQQKPDLTINYYKLVSRNRFYVPYKNGTLAVSLVGGIEENLEKGVLKNPDGTPQMDGDTVLTEGYIPNIKVFRLTGMDIVRGFNDEEINRLPNGDDLADVRIQNKAYLVNLKVEPRYFLTDNLMAGVFYDAGRVFVDHVNLSELRDSVGVSFKIVTPVGTLDFDYGIKLLREKDKDGKLESPGRFHVSIGFF